MGVIPLTRGFVVTVDDADYEWLSQWKWYYQPRHPKTPGIGYAARKVWSKERQELIFMHRLIMGVHGMGRKVQVDHVNGDTLDCRRENLRIATRSQNGANSVKKPSRGGACPSRYKGVTYDARSGDWCARLRVDGKSHSSSHGTEEEAARAYDRLAHEHFGEFARLNFPSDYRRTIRRFWHHLAP